MNWFNIALGFLLTLHVIVCILLLLIVLMQRPRSEGLGTAFGGGVTDTLFGSSAGNVLTKITTWLGTIFFLTTISLAYLYSNHGFIGKKGNGLGERMKSAPVKQAPVTPSESPLAVPKPAPNGDK